MSEHSSENFDSNTLKRTSSQQRGMIVTGSEQKNTNEQRSFSELHLLATELPVGDFDGAEHVLRNCSEAGLSKARVMYIMHAMSEAAEIDLGVLKALYGDVRLEHPDYGVLADASITAAALREELEKRYGG